VKAVGQTSEHLPSFVFKDAKNTFVRQDDVRFNQDSWRLLMQLAGEHTAKKEAFVSNENEATLLAAARSRLFMSRLIEDDQAVFGARVLDAE